MGKSERIEMIDALRGIAALAVVLFHYVGFIPLLKIHVGPIGAAVVVVTRYGYLGVPIFFVLSGYVIALTASRYTFTPRTGLRFVLRRLVRIAPPYWCMVLIIAATLIAGRYVGYFKNTTVTVGQVAAHIAYAQNILGVHPLDVVYWTLCLEVQFYLVFALSAVALHKCSPRVLYAWFVALTVSSVLFDLFDMVSQAWFPRLWYQFGVGVLAFYANRERSTRRALVVMLGILAVLGFGRSHAPEVTVAFLGGAFLLRNRLPGNVLHCPKGLLWLGGISYSLYLVHGFVGLWLGVGFRSLLAPSQAITWSAIVAATLGAIAFASGFYYACERRAIEWSKLIRVGPPNVAAASQENLESPVQHLQEANPA